ncbi:MAG: fatty acid desaturase [Flammeovirgaceae bacterium]
MHSKDKFYYSTLREPHFKRRKEILTQYPEVRKLFLKDPSLLYKLLFAVLIQLTIAVYSADISWWMMLLLAITVGSTLVHVLVLGIHELVHHLAFKTPAYNNILAILVNFPIIFPYAMSFRIYHLEHHWNQGVEGIDTDIPTEQEALIFRGRFGKFIWIINQIIFYGIRPALVKPLKLTKWQLINILAQLCFMVSFIFFFGWQPIIYLLLSIFFSGGLHPISGHFIAEHYVFEEGQETYSYYGFWNKITFNVGYHNEHHDFPNIPGRHLPKLNQLAFDYYKDLKSHKSWGRVLIDFWLSDTVSLFSRIKRKKNLAAQDKTRH